MSNNTLSLEQLQAKVGEDLGTSRWFPVDQARIDAFADLTEDPQWIHVDPERAAKETPFGGTIAHGFLSLSLLSAMSIDVVPRLEGAVMGINYGLDKVRFLNPVRSGSKVRGHFKLAGIEPRGDNRYLIRYAVSVEIDGVEKPAIACEWLGLTVLG
ncbi:MAG: MaoC family dehydratase [Alcanivorax sp.]|uniref:MaoC family dehydratase n=1 Tax=Alloalcanivorax marinus TaxID=1177169 RepID=A0A9Q3URD3_9GAMM|nr:MaoC family dehydratase [Alloalcanivorax marinus]MBM7334276.1 MaoC family dehydratase [Alloalcanivorax marinus]MCC4310204.1 MaoC family dehydratase [Alloalcanivorax marinus]MCH2557633.1 MaoC family dehydratase [Alcanivorax sp.]MCU5785720.1 oxidoreductase [Alloalcanivorax marinus]